MKKIFSTLLLTFLLQMFNAQTPQNPTNPFPNKNKNTPTQSPSTVPPVTSQQIPPSTQPQNNPNQPQSVPTIPTQKTPSQELPGLPPIKGSDEDQIIQTVYRVFDAMRMQDSNIAKPLFYPNCRLFTPTISTSGETRLNEEHISTFFKAISTKRPQKVDERILKYKVDIDGPLASVWADYNLYVDTTFIHCGIDVFQLYKSKDGWKIFELADTRRKTGCTRDPKDDIHSILNNWHRDAAVGNADTYFGAFASDGVFLGTDPKERWSVNEFYAFAKPYFDQKKAWDFKPSNRFINFAPDGNTAWFDEDLSTWMGPSRGSGVLAKTPQGWKIKLYNLTILVPNEKVQDYLKLLNTK